ncbi:MAG TPA: hypothetical protein VEJ63_23355 [Planctomycetota bacterium]|nr:hypothetical protein [Planctomycetota bacterium]
MRIVLCLMAFVAASVGAEESSKKEKTAAAEKASSEKKDGAEDRIAETVRKMEQMEKEFQSRGGEKQSESKKADKKTEKKDSGEYAESKPAKKQKKEKERKGEASSRTVYADSDRGDSGRRARVYYGGHAVEEGAWTEIGGLTSSSRSSSSSLGSYRNEGSHSSSSIGVRATVIRLDGPED